MFAPGTAASVATVVAADKGNSSVSGYVLPIVILLLIGFFIVNSRRRQKALTQGRKTQQDEWGPGTEIVTRAGLIATIVERHDDHVVLEVAPGVRTRFVPEAIGKIWYDESADAPAPPPPDEAAAGQQGVPPPADDHRLAD